MKLILQAIKALFRKIEASRTHWEEVEEVEILTETTVAIPEDNLYADLPKTTQLTVGQTYFVILDGVSYECVAWYSDEEEVVIIGNGAIFGGEGGNGDVLPVLDPAHVGPPGVHALGEIELRESGLFACLVHGDGDLVLVLPCGVLGAEGWICPPCVHLGFRPRGQPITQGLFLSCVHSPYFLLSRRACSSSRRGIVCVFFSYPFRIHTSVPSS